MDLRSGYPLKPYLADEGYVLNGLSGIGFSDGGDGKGEVGRVGALAGLPRNSLKLQERW